MIRPSLLLACALGLAACTQEVPLEENDPRPTGPDAGVDAGTGEDDDGGLPTAKCGVASAVDILFVIDESNSMAEEQASLAEQFPDLIDALADPPDEDGDGLPDWAAVRDLHLGVVTADMGSGGYAVPTCDEPDFGDDGILQTRGNTALPGCMETYPDFLSARLGVDDPEALAQDFACVARVGTGGCGFEQPLEAALKALTPSDSPLTFHAGTTGHGDGANAGFLRPGSLLAVIVVTDEDDCSAADPELYDPSSATYGASLNLRCTSHPEALTPLERYVDGLSALRPDADLFAFGVIAGVPPDLTSERGDPPYEEILADPRMQVRPDPDDPNLTIPSCDVPGLGQANPPRRLVQLASRFERQSVVQSICQPDFAPAVRVVAELVGRRACTEPVD